MGMQNCVWLFGNTYAEHKISRPGVGQNLDPQSTGAPEQQDKLVHQHHHHHNKNNNNNSNNKSSCNSNNNSKI